MNLPIRTSTLVLALSVALALPSAGALAAGSTGGASAPSPAAPAKHIRPSGIATWFGPGFYGKQTACGQVLTPAVIGVAHRTLPCGTLVRVSYAGRSITVP